MTVDTQIAEILERKRADAWADVIPPMFAEPLDWDTLDPTVTQWVRNPTGVLLLVGATGPGKTHAAFTVAHRLCVRQALPFRWWTAEGMLTELAPGGDDRTDTAVTSTRLVLIDDLGAEPDTAWRTSTVGRIIDTRWANRLPTIITSNLTFAELAARYSTRVTSRINGEVTAVLFDGPDRRVLFGTHQV